MLSAYPGFYRLADMPNGILQLEQKDYNETLDM